jgi:hypothetical protein
VGVIKVNGIRFEAPSRWSFHPFQGLILGRPDSESIVVQITSAFKDPLKPSDGHDRCAAITREFVTPAERVNDFETPTVCIY